MYNMENGHEPHTMKVIVLVFALSFVHCRYSHVSSMKSLLIWSWIVCGDMVSDS